MKIQHYFLALLLALGIRPAQANVVGVDAQNFNSITNGLDFVTVHSSETLKPGLMNFGVFLNYSRNTLPTFANSADEQDDSLLTSDFNFGLGIMKNWDAGISFPFLLKQSVNESLDRLEFTNTGNTEVRVNTKYRLMGDDNGGVAVIGSLNFNRVSNSPYVGDKSSPIFNIELAADTTLSHKVALAGNVGYRHRSPGEPISLLPSGEIEIYPLESQFIASGAISYLFENTRLIGEIFSSYPTKETPTITNRGLSTLEFLAGIKHNFNQNLSAHIGGGTELNQGTSTPDWRVYTGLNYAMEAPWSKKKKKALLPYKITEEGPVDLNLEEKETEEKESFAISDILFGFNSDEVLGETKHVLDQLGAYLNRPPRLKKLVIEGHTDSIGPGAYNETLSRRRATRVGLYLVEEHKIPRNRIRIIGYGESRPVADNGNYQGRELNRRVEFDILRVKKRIKRKKHRKKKKRKKNKTQ